MDIFAPILRQTPWCGLFQPPTPPKHPLKYISFIQLHLHIFISKIYLRTFVKYYLFMVFFQTMRCLNWMANCFSLYHTKPQKHLYYLPIQSSGQKEQMCLPLWEPWTTRIRMAGLGATFQNELPVPSHMWERFPFKYNILIVFVFCLWSSRLKVVLFFWFYCSSDFFWL